MDAAKQPPLDALVIGAGISGLACLWRLRALGFRAACIEAAERVGGSIRTQERDGFLVELAATSVMPSAELLDLLPELRLEDEVVSAPAKLPRFVFRHGRLHALPLGAAGLLGTSLLPARAKWRLLAESWTAARRGDGEDESVESFVARRFGREAAEAVASPFVSGTFGGDPRRLSARAVFPKLVELENRYGSVLRGLARSGRTNGTSATAKHGVISLRGGLEALPRRLHERLRDSIHLGARAERVEKQDLFRVPVSGRGGSRPFAARAVVVATPPVDAGAMLASLSREAGRDLAEVEAPPLASVSLGWRRSEVEHPLAGFGFLVAPGEGARILGCFWASSVFPERAPVGHVAMTTFIGGARDCETGRLEDSALVDVVRRDLGRIVGAEGTPRVLAVCRHARAIPQYTIGHEGRLRRIRTELASVAGLFLTGNYLDGIGVGDCVRRAMGTAGEVADFLRTHPN